MRSERKFRAIREFSGPLWDDPSVDFGEAMALVELVKTSHQDPERFHREWVDPLLSEGLDLDRVFDLLLSGTVRPN